MKLLSSMLLPAIAFVGGYELRTPRGGPIDHLAPAAVSVCEDSSAMEANRNLVAQVREYKTRLEALESATARIAASNKSSVDENDDAVSDVSEESRETGRDEEPASRGEVVRVRVLRLVDVVGSEDESLHLSGGTMPDEEADRVGDTSTESDEETSEEDRTPVPLVAVRPVNLGLEDALGAQSEL